MVRLAHRITGPLSSPRRIIYDHELVWVTGGQGKLVFEDRVLPWKSGSLFLLPPFLPHQFLSATPKGGHLAIHFDWAPGVPKAGRGERSPYRIHIGDRPVGFLTPGSRTLGPTLEAMETVVNHYGRPEPWRLLESRGAMLGLVSWILREMDSTPGEGAGHHARLRVDQALRFAGEHLGEPLTPADLARTAGMSPSHFNRVFRQTQGISPAEGVRRLRVQRARELLAMPGLSIREIAFRVGFEDPLHFSRVFRHYDGLPPTRWREQALGGHSNK